MTDDNRENGAPAEEDAIDGEDVAADENIPDETAGEDVAADETIADEYAGDDPVADETDDREFARRVEEARNLIGEDATALYVGVVREGREVDSTFAQQADGPQQEGMQALSLLASHIRLVSDEAGVDYTTVAADAVTLAEQLDESE